jgi:hypothetical protein
MKQKGFVNILSILILAVSSVLGAFSVSLASPSVIFKNIAGDFNSLTSVKAESNPIRGNAGDLIADIVLGKPNFSEVTPYSTVQEKLYLPHGVIFDRNVTPNKMYIYDAGNNRILGVDLSACLGDPANCSPSLVIGQPDMNSSACNGDSGFQNYPNRAPASASSLCGEQESQLSISEGGSGASMAIDSQSNLYVFDAWNNRVLKYDNPFATDTVADDIWGQDNFTDNSCNKGNPKPDVTSLCYSWGNSNNWTAGVDIDSSGNLWVVDNGNNRVLRFPSGSKTADLVLGQSDFTSNDPGSDLNQLNAPAAVRVNSQGWVYVADQGNQRVIVYKGTLTDGVTGALFGSGFVGPSGLDFDPTQPGIWVSDYLKVDIELWDEDTDTLVETLGQTGNGNMLGDASGSIGIDSTGDVFTAIGTGDYDNDILMFAKNGSLTTPSQVLFSGANSGYIDAKGLASVDGVAVADGQVIVGDEGRILFWNDPTSLYSGKSADGVIEASSFSTLQGGCCATLKTDKNHHLWVSFMMNADLPDQIQVFQLPLVTGEQPFQTIKFPLNVLGGGQLPFPGYYEAFEGIAPSDSGDFVWLSHPSTNRVIRIRNPLTDPVVDVVLGQTDLTGTSCNMGGTVAPDTLCNPGGLATDNFGNLYVSDDSLESQGNMRLLEFNNNLFPTDNTSVIFATSASKIFPDIETWTPAFDSQNRMVTGYNPYWTSNPLGGWFPGVYNNPLTATAPDSTLSDYYSMAFTATFDSNDNLYVGDLDRARLLIYDQPFGTPTTAQVSNSNSQGSQGPPSCYSTSPTNAPNLWRVTVSGTTAMVYFTSVAPATGYQIFYGYSGGDTRFATTATSSPATIGDLNPNTTYYFSVKGVNVCAGGPLSAWVSGNTTGRTGSSNSGRSLPNTGTDWPTIAEIGIGIIAIVGSLVLAL